MKRLLVLVVAVLMAAAVWGAPAADNGLMRGTPDSNHLYLYEKGGFVCEEGDVMGVDCWYIMDKGAWGKLHYWPMSFVFNGHGLMPSTEYCLINYVDSWPGTESLLLGMGISNKGGNINIMGGFDFSTLMPLEGAKIWLVPCADFMAPESGTIPGCMIGWHPEMYLFEYALI